MLLCYRFVSLTLWPMLGFGFWSSFPLCPTGRWRLSLCGRLRPGEDSFRFRVCVQNPELQPSEFNCLGMVWFVLFLFKSQNCADVTYRIWGQDCIICASPCDLLSLGRTTWLARACSIICILRTLPKSRSSCPHLIRSQGNDSLTPKVCWISFSLVREVIMSLCPVIMSRAHQYTSNVVLVLKFINNSGLDIIHYLQRSCDVWLAVCCVSFSRAAGKNRHHTRAVQAVLRGSPLLLLQNEK